MWLISHLISVAPVAGCKMSATGDNATGDDDGRTGLLPMAPEIGATPR
jgi:hypothetical protein